MGVDRTEQIARIAPLIAKFRHAVKQQRERDEAVRGSVMRALSDPTVIERIKSIAQEK